MKQINGTSLLVTVAEDLSNEPVLKVWALDTELKDGSPRCLSTVSVQNARRQFPVRLPRRAKEREWNSDLVYRFRPLQSSKIYRR